jgi:hypothetical protein
MPAPRDRPSSHAEEPMKLHRRAFAAGSALWLVVGVLHLAVPFVPTGADPTYERVRAAMKSYVFEGWLVFDLHDVMQVWGIFIGLLALLVGAIGVMVLRTTRDALLTRRLALVNVAFLILMIAAALGFQTATPIPVLGLLLAVFGVAWRTGPAAPPLRDLG